MLNLGIRVFDLRFAYNPGNDTLGFHHSEQSNSYMHTFPSRYRSGPLGADNDS